MILQERRRYELRNQPYLYDSFSYPYGSIVSNSEIETFLFPLHRKRDRKQKYRDIFEHFYYTVQTLFGYCKEDELDKQMLVSVGWERSPPQ